MIRVITRALFGIVLITPVFDSLRAEFRVTHFLANAQTEVRSLDQAIALSQGQGLVDMVSECASTINYWDGVADGHFPNSLLFPEGFDDRFVLLANAVLNIPLTGNYTFGTNSDDGAQVLVDGQSVILDDSNHAVEDRFGTIFLEAGLHNLVLIFFEGGGEGAIELFAADGTRSEFSGDFRLVGDTANGGLSTTEVEFGDCQAQLGFETSSEERAALIALYQATAGDNWINSSGWKDEPTLPDGFNEDPCSNPSWYGVTCSLSDEASFTVASIVLNSNGLSGPIPVDLGSLANLTRLELFGNQLSGPIPPELGSLTRLTALVLGDNRLEGPIPPQLGQLVELVTLNLRANRLSGTIPAEITLLESLQVLTFAGNRLTGSIPSVLPPRLTFLSLSNNQFEGPIPPELGNLSALYLLELASNRLSGPIPPELANLTSLTVCDLGFNLLEGPIPPELGNLSEIYLLSLSGNRLTGPVPPELGNLSRLLFLAMFSNRLTGPVPATLGQLSNLIFLWFPDNQLSGSIPAELGNLSHLRELDLTLNELTGVIPSELGQLSNVDGIYLAGNHLTGNIPESLGQLPKLNTLDLSFNHLGGSIPAALGSATSLTELWLLANELTGPIPPELGQLSNLQYVNLRHNWLQGEIPGELALPPDLELLSLSGNELSGQVPAELTALPTGVIDLRHNRLESVEGGLSPQLDLAQAGAADWQTSQRVVAAYSQLAIGGGFQAVVIISNLHRLPWSGRGYLSGGQWPEDSTWTLDGEDQTGRSDFEIELAPMETRRLVIGGGMNAAAGWLLIRAEEGFSAANVAVSFFYNLSDSEGLLDSTGVDGSELSGAFYFPAERSSLGVDTGVAVRGVASHVRYRLVDQTGQRAGQDVIIEGDGARLLADILPGLPENFVGRLIVSSPDFPFYVTVLRIEPDKNGGIQLTSVPPISFEGRHQRQ